MKAYRLVQILSDDALNSGFATVFALSSQRAAETEVIHARGFGINFRNPVYEDVQAGDKFYGDGVCS